MFDEVTDVGVSLTKVETSRLLLAGVGACKIAVDKDCVCAEVWEVVRCRPTFGSPRDCGNPMLYSTISSSKRFRLIDREEL